MRTVLCRVALGSVLAAACVLTLAPGALAVSGTRLHVAELAHFGKPVVAVDAAGTAYIAWANEVRLPKEGDLIEYCVLPAGASACTHQGHMRLESGEEPYIGKVQVLVDGTTVILLATDDFGLGGNKYEPVQEWQSTDGGASFTKVIGGKSVSNYGGGADNAVIVPGTDALGIGASEPSFDEFPLSPLHECSVASCPDSPFATLQAAKNKTEHPLADLGGVFASDLVPGQQGVLGVYPTFSLQKQCNGESSSVTDYVYGQGAQEAGHSYDLAPGPGSAWQKELTPGGCEVTNVAVAGGPSGLGVAENDTTRGYTVYQRFNQTTEEFEPSYTTIATEMESQPSLSQDGAGGLYLTYYTFYGANLAYSSNGGASWTGPAQFVAEQYGVSNLSSAVGPNGQGWAVWTREESIYAQQFVARDAVPPPPPPPPSKTTTTTTTPPPPTPNSGYTIQSITGNTNGTVTIVFVPTQSGKAILVLTVPTASIATATAAKSKKCKHGQSKIKGKCLPTTTVAGKTSAAGTAGVPLKLTVNLSSKIKALLKKGKSVHLIATLTYTSALGGTATVHTYSVTVKGHKPKKK